MVAVTVAGEMAAAAMVANRVVAATVVSKAAGAAVANSKAAGVEVSSSPPVAAADGEETIPEAKEGGDKTAGALVSFTITKSDRCRLLLITFITVVHSECKQGISLKQLISITPTSNRWQLKRLLQWWRWFWGWRRRPHAIGRCWWRKPFDALREQPRGSRGWRGRLRQELNYFHQSHLQQC